MSDFSQRFGYSSIAHDLEETEMPSSLKAGIWDMISLNFFSDISKHSVIGPTYSDNLKVFCNLLWFEFFREPTDTLPKNPHQAVVEIRHRFFAFTFDRMYAFIEYASQIQDGRFVKKGGPTFPKLCNQILERERATFRFAGNTLVKVSEKEHLAEIAISITQDLSRGVRDHIKRAAELYSMIPDPDYRNSIKESISSVESAVAFVIGRKTSGIAKPLKSIAARYGIHQSLSEGFEKIYAWTSDESGIRHRLMESSSVSQDDARFMLVSCSAFSNYLMALHAKFGTAIAD